MTMDSDKFFNILEGFDFNLLNNPEFREDSVREEIVSPIIKGLGYSAAKPNQIIRSRKLLHPFVSIGSQRKEIFIVPDYLMEVDGKPAWILDAKSPSESIVKSAHVEQAYSYAMHSEVRVKYFALCNGREFSLYSVDKVEPVFHFPLKAIPVHWDSLKHFLSPSGVLVNSPFKMSKDLGLHLKRLGFDIFKSLVFPRVPITHIGQLDPDMFTFSTGVNDNGTSYVVSFDFGQTVFEQLKSKIPEEAIDKLSKRNSGQRQGVEFADRVFYVDIDCRIGIELQENEDEIWQPLLINRILT